MTLKYKDVHSGSTGTVTRAARKIHLEAMTGSCQAYDCCACPAADMRTRYAALLLSMKYKRDQAI